MRVPDVVAAVTRASPRVRLAAGAALAALLAFVASVVAPLRASGGDTVPGRLGAAVLACDGSWDLGRVEWLGARAARGRAAYYVQPDAQGGLVSTFGPGPALLGAPAMVGLAAGDTVDDVELQRRARRAAAGALALAAALLVLAVAASASPSRAALAGATAALSFAGAATLGQALWQQSAALPWIVGAFACLAWQERRPRLALLAPALLAVSLALRPVELGLALGVGAAWLVQSRRRPRVVGLALLLAAAALVPFALWNLQHVGSVWPLAQVRANRAMTAEGALFVLTPGHALGALAGLLVSPARGLVLFAPLALVGVGRALVRGNTGRSLVAAGILMQLAIAACFFKWWGGLGFGPRLLAGAVWLAIGLAFAAPGARRLVALAGGVTVLVGLVGLSAYEPSKWEARRNPDQAPAVLWDLEDSPLAAMLARPAAAPPLRDAPVGPFRFCAPGAAAVLAEP